MCSVSSGTIKRCLQCFFARTHMLRLQLGDDRQLHATYNCSIIDIYIYIYIYQLELFDSHIIFLNIGFICIMDILNIWRVI